MEVDKKFIFSNDCISITKYGLNFRLSRFSDRKSEPLEFCN